MSSITDSMRTRESGRDAVVERLRRVAADTLAPVVGDSPFALVDFPDHPNVGDSAIWLGTTAFFRKHRGMEPAYVATTRTLSGRELQDALPHGPIFIHGGGNFGDLWPRHHEFREHLLERFPDREIIQLPQSIHFQEPGRAARTARLIARHGRFRLFVRDRASYEFAAARFDCEVRLCPDMALFLGPLVREPPRSMCSVSCAPTRSARFGNGWAGPAPLVGWRTGWEMSGFPWSWPGSALD